MIMDVRPRHIALFAGLVIVVVLALGALIEAAGKSVAVAVSVAAIAFLVASCVWTGLVTVRSAGDEDAIEQVQRRGRTHIGIMFGAPLVLIAAHPWGRRRPPSGSGSWSSASSSSSTR